MSADARLHLKTRVNMIQSAHGSADLFVRTSLRLRRLACALLAVSTFFLQSTQAAQPTPLADVPLLTIGSQPRVEVRFGTRDAVECVVDTGADTGMINHELSRGANSLGRPKVTVAGSRPISMPLVEVRDVAIGQAAVKFTRFVVRDRSWVDTAYAMPCVLGGSFLDRFTVDLDFLARRLRLYKRGTRISALIGADAANEYDLGAPGSYAGIRVDAFVNGTKTRAYIDTGWGPSSANGALLEALGIETDDSRMRVDRTVLRSGGERTSRLLDLGPIRIGNNIIPSHPIDFGDNANSYAGRKLGPYLHVGSDLLANYRLLIDAAKGQVVLMPGDAGN